MAASSTHAVAVALPLMVGLVMTLATIVIEATTPGRDRKFYSPPPPTWPHRRLVLARCNYRIDCHRARGRCAFGRDLHLGGGVRLMRSVQRTFSCLLQLRDALHDSGHRRSGHVLVMETVGALRDSGWDASIRSVDRYSHFRRTDNSSQEVLRSSKLLDAMNVLRSSAAIAFATLILAGSKRFLEVMSVRARNRRHSNRSALSKNEPRKHRERSEED